jgi:hypothetical protein
MAELIALRTALQRLGFSQAASLAITDEQALDSLDELKLLVDSEVKDLCTALRKPGGLIANPNNAAGQAAQIPDPGVKVPLRAETNLKMA